MVRELKNAGSRGHMYSGQGVHNLNEEVEYKRFILNLDEELIQDIEDIVFELKKEGAEGYDIKTGKYKKMNKSLWAREIFVEAVRNYKQEKQREHERIQEKENLNNDEFDDVKTHILNKIKEQELESVGK